MDRGTIEYYDHNAQDWTETHGGSTGPSYWQDHLDQFVSRIPAGGQILEIGSGPGKDAGCFSDENCHYLGLDLSTGLLDVAKKANPDLNFVCADVCNLPFPNNIFNGVWCASTLFHIPRSKLSCAISEIVRVIKNDGTCFVTMKEGKGSLIEEATGRLFCLYQPQEFDQILAGHGLQIVTREIIPTQGWTTWIAYLLILPGG